ncbi:Polysaccharide deacetylase (fragment) [groundwater metagenome]|uniref:Polysaccharide deacetylase n=1 Tax=groundwater metagenome TaxID=717931 RepID=A0A098EDI5_9ZZZZ
MDKAGGDPEEAIIIFEDELKKFREIYDVKTICMHGNPLTKHDNRDLWNKYDYRKFGIIGEAYLSMKEDVAYFSDTGRTWGKEYKIKDFNINISSNYNNYDCNSNYNSKIKTTDDLINLIKIGLTQF